jgi:hypothetical protein
MAHGREDPTQVSPTFAWPKGLQATVEVRQIADKTDQPHVEMTTRCRLAWQPHAKGMLITCREATISPEYPGEFSSVSNLLRIAAEFDWIVSAKGEFVGLINTDRLVAAMWKLPGPSTVPPEQRQKVAELSMAANDADARNSWAMLVSAWPGPPMPLGKDIAVPGDLEVPLVPGVPVKGRQSIRAERWLPCPGRAQTRCVELHADTAVDPAGYAETLDRFFKDNATRPLGEVIRRADYSREVVLVTDPATLVPYRLSVKTRSTVAYGEGKEARQDVEKVWTFTYPAAKDSVPGLEAPRSSDPR